MRLRSTLLPLATLVVAAAVPAVAATPESGTVSKDSPSVTWEGTANGYAVFPTNLLLTSAGEEPAPCEAPTCDTFALKVVDKYDLNVVAQQRGGDNFTELHVITPAGEKLYVQSADGEAARIRVKQAAPGDYTVEVLTNESLATSGEYDASATLNTGGAIAPPPPAPAQPAPPAAPQPAATLTLATKKVSAKKKRFALAVSSDRGVTDFRLALKKGRKVIARGALKALDGKGKVVLKVKRKLKRGTYLVAMTARDGDRTVGVETKLKVVR